MSGCDGRRWICEEHPTKGWEGSDGCGCGAPGMPRPICNTDDPPELPLGFTVDADKDRSRH
jgi:hypothetical protein